MFFASFCLGTKIYLYLLERRSDFVKRSMFTLVLLLFLILPFKVKAANISNVTISSNGIVKSGEQIVVTLTASISNYNQNEGIWLTYTKLTYDQSHLALINVSSSGYDTAVQYNDNGAEIASEAIENSSIGNTCVEGLLQCGNYVLTLKFQATNVVANMDSAIVMSEFGIGTIAITENREYTLDDVDGKTYSKMIHHDLKLQVNTSSVEEKTPVTVVEQKTNSDNSKKTSTPTANVTKSSNNYLKSLEIKNYLIDFNKDNTEYTITIDSDVNSLEINQTVEDSKATSTISGNENLKNGSVVKIVVAAEDGKTKEYKINIKKESKSEQNNNVDVAETPKIKSDKVIVKVMIGISCIIGLFILICFICVISSIRDKRKLEKILKNENK